MTATQGVARKLPDRRIARPEHPGLALRAMGLADLRQVMGWLSQPHVAARWGPPQVAIGEISVTVEAADVAPFIIMGDGRPIGYLQIYAACGDPFWHGHDLPRETFGIDLFIGAPGALRRGYGTASLQLAAAHLLAMPGVARVQGDPHPGNAASLATFARAGFENRGAITTPDGPAVYMVMERR